MIDKAFLEISNICNLRCSFCHGTKRARRMLSVKEFETLTDRMAGQVKFLYFHLLGEPLLHPDFPFFVRRAWEKGFYPILTTNGSLLAKCGQTVLENLPYKISISLHAPAANAAFADPTYFDTCIAFARQAAARGCITVLRLWNVGGEGEAENNAILAKLHEAFPDEWAPSHRDSIRLSRNKEEKIFLEWGEHFEWPDLEAEAVPANTDIFCHALRDQFGVLCDGTVVPCCLDAEGTLALGNLFDTPLDEILASPRARAIYENFTNRRAIEPLCLRCDYARRFTRK